MQSKQITKKSQHAMCSKKRHLISIIRTRKLLPQFLHSWNKISKAKEFMSPKKNIIPGSNKVQSRNKLLKSQGSIPNHHDAKMIRQTLWCHEISSTLSYCITTVCKYIRTEFARWCHNNILSIALPPCRCLLSKYQNFLSKTESSQRGNYYGVRKEVNENHQE